ncbi:MAG: HAMP domain-containing histidine kinase [Faecalibacterium sp.]|nr:HAMP domain-containing histidine kinase [Faecalibacterium sp.]
MLESNGRLDMNDGVQTRLNELMLHAVSEEFARPLNLISLNREYLQMHLEQNRAEYSHETVQQALQDIETATEGLHRITDNLVAMCACLCTAVTPQTEWLDLRSMLQGICAEQADIYRAIGVTLQLDCTDEEQYIVQADYLLAERVILNLTSNGLRACKKGGVVTFGLCAAEDGVSLTVSDTGCGMPPEQLQNLFQPFVKQENTAPGFENGPGIGLYLCGEYCRMMGWKISVQPQKNGTCIRMLIPQGGQLPPDSVVLHSPLQQEMRLQHLRGAALRELRTVPGLQNLGRGPKAE